MKISPFTYHRPDSLEQACALLAEHGDESKVLAGGQSLLPIMALRLGRPEHVVDIGAIPGLDAINVGRGSGDKPTVSIGALVRHAQAERSDELAELAPIVHQAMPHISHRAIRTRGTVCGSIAHADPAAEMPAVCVAADATMTATSIEGTRHIAAADFFHGYLDTELRADEILTQLTFPAAIAGQGTSVVEESRRQGDFALIGLACSLRVEATEISEVALSFFGAASTAVRCTEAEEVLVGQEPSAARFAEAARIVSKSLTPGADIHASANYRQPLAGVLTIRGLAEAHAAIKTGASA